MGTPAGFLSDVYGIKASLVANIALMVPGAVLSWFLCQVGGPFCSSQSAVTGAQRIFAYLQQQLHF